IKEEKWTALASLPYALSAHTGVVWPTDKLLVFSGDKGKTFHKTEELIVKIQQEEDKAVQKKLIREKNDLQKNHPGFSGAVLAYDINEDTWQKIDSIPFPGQVTTTAV